MKMYVMNKKYRVELKKPEFTQICALLLNKISVKGIRIALKTKQNTKSINKAAVYPAV